MICELRCEVSQVIYNDEFERSLFICRRKRSPRDVTSLFVSSRKALLIIAIVTFCPFLLLVYCCYVTCCDDTTNNSEPIQMIQQNDSSQNNFNKQLISSHATQTDDHITNFVESKCAYHAL
ncbi:GDP-Man:Man(3)GlcNAc(2)-PP-Dol alpha-1,2-mannosyltransferase [Dirofilaria immitis]